MIKLIVLVKRKPGTSREEFIDYYERNHAPLGMRLCGHLWTKYIRNYPANMMNYNSEADSTDDLYDSITEIWVKDDAAYAEMERVLSQPDVNAEVLADEERFQDRRKTRMFVVREVETDFSA